ncbi:alcohol dehydrogenase catalytic domain-containing protein [Prochlorococcus marinus]|uniref:alcohol dehydrogenase catalytic domain-containing protein n=1 Tax=Prochlorococcus marinus TaxID=1219 RepID=UPI0022B429D7|nr:alcohol dehydrogenase catalytic domain-containing protein [Prochlorococcus marinus]
MLILEANGKLVYRKNPNPQQKNLENCALVAPKIVGVCSSDIPRCFDGKAYFYPLTIGHEFMVEILESNSNKLIKGDKCAVFPLKPCFNCLACTRKEYNKCSNYSYYGSRENGGMQKTINIDYWNLIKLPEDFDDLSGSLIEPVAVCVNLCRKIEKNTNVLLVGGGFLSQIICQILLDKCCSVTCVDRNNYKKVFFPDNVIFIDSINKIKTELYDISIDCCGSPNAINNCIEQTNQGGKVIFLGNPSDSTSINSKEISTAMRRELTLLGSWNSRFRPDDISLCDWNEGIRLISKGKLSLKSLITHESMLENSPELLSKINRRRVDRKILPNFNKAIIHID